MHCTTHGTNGFTSCTPLEQPTKQHQNTDSSMPLPLSTQPKLIIQTQFNWHRLGLEYTWRAGIHTSTPNTLSHWYSLPATVMVHSNVLWWGADLYKQQCKLAQSCLIKESIRYFHRLYRSVVSYFCWTLWMCLLVGYDVVFALTSCLQFRRR